MATVTKGRTFVSGETVTPEKLNELVDNATVAAIQTADIADGQITNAKVSDSAAIALSKLATGALPTAITVASANIVDGTIVNADINASAAIAGSKLADTSVGPAKLSQPYTLATAQASTSGTSIDFTGIPSWVRRITIMFAEVSTNGTNDVLVRLGDAGGIEDTGYVSTSNTFNTSNATTGVTRTDGFAMYYSSAAHLLTGHMLLTKIDGNLWVSSHFGKLTTTNAIGGAGSKTLSDTLTQVRITTVGGTNTFDAGTINVSYE